MFKEIILSASQFGTKYNVNLPKNTPDNLVANAANVFLVVIGIIAVISIITSAIMMITANGSSDKVATARRNLLWSIIGLVIALLAGVIVNLVIGLV